MSHEPQHVPLVEEPDDEHNHNNSNTTNNSNNNDNNTTTAAVTNTNVFQLTVKTLTGQQFPVDLPLNNNNTPTNNNLKVIDVKQHIATTQDIPVNFQRLIFRGQELKDDEYIARYNIESGVVLHLVLRRENVQAQTVAVQPAHAQGNNEGVMAGGLGLFGMPVPAAVDGLDYMRITEAQRLGAAVKVFTFIDGVFLLIFALAYYPLFIGWLLCVCGYYGAHHYRWKFLILYMLYIILNVAVRLYWMTSADSASVGLISGLSIIVECFIFNIVFRFLRTLRAMSPAEREYLVARNRAGMMQGDAFV